MPDGYRSYLVRVRTHRHDPESTQVEVEDLLRGGRTRIIGGTARMLGDQLETLAATEDDDVSGMIQATPVDDH